MRFRTLPGVVECIVGYTGGTTGTNPTYHNMQDYTEALWIEYDPQQISYTQLLEYWIRMHNPSNTKSKCQYRAAVWYLHDEQRTQAEFFLTDLQARLGKPVTSAVEPATTFYRAEDYHQDFIANQRW